MSDPVGRSPADTPAILRDDNPTSPTFGTDILTTEEALVAVEQVCRATIGRSRDA